MKTYFLEYVIKITKKTSTIKSIIIKKKKKKKIYKKKKK